MSNIQNRFHDSLERAVRDHLVGNSSGPRETWHWSLKPVQDHRLIIKKLRMILSWVFGDKVLTMTSDDVLKHTIEEYKKYDYDSFLTMKYGEYWC